MEFFGLTADLTPAVRLINVENMEKFKYDGDIDAAGLTAFLNTFKAGGVKVCELQHSLSLTPVAEASQEPGHAGRLGRQADQGADGHQLRAGHRRPRQARARFLLCVSA